MTNTGKVSGAALFRNLKRMVDISVPTVAYRDSIKTYRRRWGMVVAVFDDGDDTGLYELRRGHSSDVLSDNENWLKAGGGECIVTQDVLANTAAGAIKVGDTVTEGTEFTDFVIQLLTGLYTPELIAPSAQLQSSMATAVEAGHIDDLTLTMVYDRGDIKGDMEDGLWNEDLSQGHRAGAADYYVMHGDNMGSVNNKTIDDYQVVDGANTFSAEVFYLAGIQPKDSAGEDYETPLEAGSIGAARTIHGRRNLFYGYSNAGDTSELIRDLQHSSLHPQNGTQFSIVIPIGATTVVVAYPATLRDWTSVIQEKLGMDIKGAFDDPVTVAVEGANGYAAIDYKVYVFTPIEPFQTSETYNVTI